jgi:hypothetical protein
MECNSGDMVVNNDLTLYSSPFVNGHGGGCQIITKQTLGPGYYEAKLKGDDGNGNWYAFWGVWGNSSCGGDVAQNGAEIDILEAWNGSGVNGVIWDGYGSCDQQWHGQTQLTLQAADGYHIWGANYGDSGAITFYRDGVETSRYAPTDGVGTTLGKIFLDNAAFSNPPQSNGMKVAWVRYYHH